MTMVETETERLYRFIETLERKVNELEKWFEFKLKDIERRVDALYKTRL